jgi:NAD(P)-dependent dehydrogenase (short-subunit alcohol dehydrogenase family)
LDKKVGDGEENVLPIEYDATEMSSVEVAFEQVKQRTDGLSLILHFAGIYTLNSLVEYTEAEFIKAFDINVFGVYRVNKTFLPLLQKGSKIIITTSELAPLDPLPFTGLYAVTKSTLDKYAYSLRMELQLLGISVVVFRPGAVDTGLLDVSTRALDAFCKNTKLYSCNAKRFKRVVENVEARKVSPEKVAKKVCQIARKRKPKYIYTLNRNPLLLLLNVLPARLQTWIIKQILK